MKIIRFPLMAMGMVALLAAMWAGLVRLGWGWPPLQPALPIAHGPLIISSFLGTVIGVAILLFVTNTGYTMLGANKKGLFQLGPRRSGVTSDK